MVTRAVLCLNRNLILWGCWGFFSHNLLIKREEEEEPWRSTGSPSGVGSAALGWHLGTFQDKSLSYNGVGLIAHVDG